MSTTTARTRKRALMSCRELVAEHILKQAGEYKKLISLKLGKTPRKVTDSNDIFSTVLHRMDKRISSSSKPIEPEEIEPLVRSVIDSAIVDSARKATSINRVEKRHAEMRTNDHESERDGVPDLIDYAVMRMIGDGKKYRHISEALGITEAAARMRMSRARKYITERLDEQDH